jgi:hypothetical protein
MICIGKVSGKHAVQDPYHDALGLTLRCTTLRMKIFLEVISG